MMKKYIAPEMEISKFAFEDIITVSGDTPVTAKIEEAANPTYNFNAAATYGEFNG